MTTELIEAARGGDGEAFRLLTEPYRREIQAHCYRMLASAQDAEDALQETMLSAWRALGGFEGRASLRTWLYKVATNCCLNMLRSADRKPPMNVEGPGWLDPTAAERVGEVAWLQPYPDLLLEQVADRAPGPEARYESTESISLAFVTALQKLPPRQRAALVLRDVLGFRAAEAAEILEVSLESVNSALKRARAKMDREFPQGEPNEMPAPPDSPEERQMAARLTTAFAAGDVGGLIDLLTEDVRVSMPPWPLVYVGRRVAREAFEKILVGAGNFKLVETRANGQPAFGVYVRDPEAEILRAFGLMVVTLRGAEISAITQFDTGTLPRFGLPRMLPT